MENQITDIKNEIKEYLKHISGVMQKVMNLSGGLLKLNGGRVVFKDDLRLPSIRTTTKKS